MKSNDLTEDGTGNYFKNFNDKKSKVEGERYLKIYKEDEVESVIFPYQKEMIGRILDLEETTAEDVMVHRIDIKAIEKSSTLSEFLSFTRKNKFSFIPVFEEDIDSIVGIISVKEFLQCYSEKKLEGKSLEFLMKKPIFVPESMKCEAVYRLLKKESKRMAVVVDEYGGTSGIVTLKDVVEFVFSGIYEKNHLKRKLASEKGSAIFNGDDDLNDVNDVLDIYIEKKPSFDTIGGFLVDSLGRIPEQNEHPTVEFDSVKFEILSVNQRHIEKVKAVKVR